MDKRNLEESLRSSRFICFSDSGGGLKDGLFQFEEVVTSV